MASGGVLAGGVDPGAEVRRVKKVAVTPLAMTVAVAAAIHAAAGMRGLAVGFLGFARIHGSGDPCHPGRGEPGGWGEEAFDLFDELGRGAGAREEGAMARGGIRRGRARRLPWCRRSRRER